MEVVDLATVLKYMSSVTNVDASRNSISKFVVPASGIYKLQDGKVALDSLKFIRKAISLYLVGTTINQSVLDEAMKNVTTTLAVSTLSGEKFSINEASNKLNQLTVIGTLNVYKCRIQTLSFTGSYLHLRGDLSDISISNLKLSSNVTTNISFTSADVALKFIADWSQTNPSDIKFSITLLGGKVSECVTALKDYNSEANAGRGFTEANKELAIKAIMDCVKNGYVEKGSKYEDMLKQLGLAIDNKPWKVTLTSAGANKTSVIKVVRDQCGIGLVEAKALCDEVPSLIAGFETRDEAVALKSAIEAAGGTAEVLGSSTTPSPVVEANNCEVVLTSYGSSKVTMVKTLRNVCGLSIVEANTLCSSLPAVIATGKTKSEAEAIKSAVEKDGGTAEINIAKNEWNVMLTSYGSSKVAVIKAVQNLTGLGLLDAKSLVESAPVLVVTVGSLSEAQSAKAAIEEAGGTAAIE